MLLPLMHPLLVGIACIAFAYLVLLRLPTGYPRFIALLPWIPLLYQAVLSLDTVHLRSIIAFFYLWMIPSKLLLVCWNAGPAKDPDVTSSFLRFFATVGLSINIPASNSQGDDHRRISSSSCCWKRDFKGWIEESLAWQAVFIRAFVKFCLVVVLFRAYAFRQELPELVLYAIYTAHIYLAVSLIFEGLAAVAAATIGIELEAQFDKPFLADSISDFWSRRWNRLVSSVLRASVYEPSMSFMIRWFGTGSHDQLVWIKGVATMLTFLVSGLMHELIYFVMNRSYRTPPTWEVTAFFVINGIATVLEAIVRRARRRSNSKQQQLLNLPRPVRTVLTLGFLFGTASWLFFPPLHRPGTCFQAISEFEHALQWFRLKLVRVITTS